MPPTIDIIRAAHATTNRARTELSSTGIDQCWELIRGYPYRRQVKQIFSSPLTRAIQTGVNSFLFPESWCPRLVLVAELQATSAEQRDTGAPSLWLHAEFGYGVDVSKLPGEHWYLKGPLTKYFPSLERVEARACEVRNWLRVQARQLNDDDRVVVITHGFFAHFLLQDFAGFTLENPSGYWQHARFRSFQFADLHGQDLEAHLEETPESRSAFPDRALLSEEERARQKALAVNFLRRQEVWASVNALQQEIQTRAVRN